MLSVPFSRCNSEVCVGVLKPDFSQAEERTRASDRTHFSSSAYVHWQPPVTYQQFLIPYANEHTSTRVVMISSSLVRPFLRNHHFFWASSEHWFCCSMKHRQEYHRRTVIWEAQRAFKSFCCLCYCFAHIKSAFEDISFRLLHTLMDQMLILGRYYSEDLLMQ